MQAWLVCMFAKLFRLCLPCERFAFDPILCMDCNDAMIMHLLWGIGVGARLPVRVNERHLAMKECVSRVLIVDGLD